MIVSPRAPVGRAVGGSVRRQAIRRRHAACNRSYHFAAHHTPSWWRWYYSRKQIALRRRRKLKATRRHQAKIRREKRFMHMAGRKFVKFPHRSPAWWRRFDRAHGHLPDCVTPQRKKGRTLAGGRGNPISPVKSRKSPGCRQSLKAASAKASGRAARSAKGGSGRSKAPNRTRRRRPC